MDDPQREQTHAALTQHFERNSSPRAILGGIVILTGGVGFLTSYGLLKLGEMDMCIRYPVAVGAAYAAFLGSLRLWVEFERRRFDQDPANLPIPEPPRHARFSFLKSHGKSWPDFLDILDFTAADEGCFVGCALVLVAAVFGGALAFTIASAPALISDVFLDAVLMTMLYKRLKTAARRHWLGTAIRRTGIAALVIAVLLSISGGMIQIYRPKAKSIGDLWRTAPTQSNP